MNRLSIMIYKNVENRSIRKTSVATLSHGQKNHFFRHFFPELFSVRYEPVDVWVYMSVGITKLESCFIFSFLSCSFYLI